MNALRKGGFITCLVVGRTVDVGASFGPLCFALHVFSPSERPIWVSPCGGKRGQAQCTEAQGIAFLNAPLTRAGHVAKLRFKRWRNRPSREGRI